MELAIYCLSRALESFALCLVDWGLVRRRQAYPPPGSCSRPGHLMVLLISTYPGLLTRSHIIHSCRACFQVYANTSEMVVK